MEKYVTIKLFATLKKYTPADADHYPITPGTKLRTLLDLLEIPEDSARIMFIDGVKGVLDSTLEGGETVSLFPPIGGG